MASNSKLTSVQKDQRKAWLTVLPKGSVMGAFLYNTFWVLILPLGGLLGVMHLFPQLGLTLNPASYFAALCVREFFKN